MSLLHSISQKRAALKELNETYTSMCNLQVELKKVQEIIQDILKAVDEAQANIPRDHGPPCKTPKPSKAPGCSEHRRLIYSSNEAIESALIRLTALDTAIEEHNNVLVSCIRLL
ncbi:hypothetical protein BG000_002325 [Podila horticola]|nr:hypothetical protein BG000_002325 [Podila horticola]